MNDDDIDLQPPKKAPLTARCTRCWGPVCDYQASGMTSEAVMAALLDHEQYRLTVKMEVQ